MLGQGGNYCAREGQRQRTTTKMAAEVEALAVGSFHHRTIPTTKTVEVPVAAAIDRPPAPENATVQICDLRINGFVNPNTNVVTFLNIPYARIPARFSEARLIDPRQEDGVIDATKFGPCCPQPHDVIHDMTGHLYPKVIDSSLSAEFTCLSVNIYAPSDALSSTKKLPVFAWIHGGAFTYGDASDEYSKCGVICLRRMLTKWFSDGSYMVQHSVARGKPIIVVSMNYRVGAYGFLTSKELQAEARGRGETGYANLGFHDQRLGLQWVSYRPCLYYIHHRG
jgi:carboxylesterase type B